ncbi:MAG TPA: thiamine phosphate synthase [Deltaproteobacteria bacterium]|nr:thiamine phosphate synthase [Deltaproteobacteria bacterium]
MNAQMLRIVDANINRVTEGLRAAEDVCRYAWNDRGLTKRLRAMRHGLLALVDTGGCIRARNPAGDVGVAQRAGPGPRRKDLADVARANLKRAQEGLRVLEEVFRIRHPEISAGCETMRYETYEIERKIFSSREKGLTRGLYLVLNGDAPDIPRLAETATKAGLSAIQLRWKNGSDRAFLELARTLCRIVSGTPTRFIVNDRPDIALLAGADGAHLGQDDMDPATARTLLGPDVIIGMSTHNADQVFQANTLPVDYIGFGPVFPTLSKENPGEATGLAALGNAVKASTVPVVAIGGITAEHMASVRRSGCRCAAVIGAVASDPDPCSEMVRLHAMFRETS